MRVNGEKTLPYALLSPTLLLVTLLIVLPIFQAFLLAFQASDGSFTLANFQRMASDTNFTDAIKFTFLLLICIVPLQVILALVMAWLVWLLIWRTKLGYEIRTLGFSPRAARYAGISQSRITIIAMLISGALAGMMAINPTMGDQHNVSLDFVSQAGFVGIAVALMGRSHPAGIIPAAILFGALYQGGAELAFEMPNISRDMIVIIQGLVILFAGALEHMFRPSIQTLFASLSPKLVGLAQPGKEGV